MVHTAEVLGLCRAVAEASVGRYSFIQKDVVYAAAILHDLGKVETYKINDLGTAESLPTEKTLGHLFYGMHLIKSVYSKGKSNVPPEFVNDVLHCVASHHGSPEFGSIKVVQSIEAGIVSRADYLSSRNGMVETVLRDAARTGQPMQSSFKIYGDQYTYGTGMDRYVTKLGGAAGGSTPEPMSDACRLEDHE